MRWFSTDSLGQKVTKKDGQLELLKLLGITSVIYYIELYDYTDLNDFLYPDRMLLWVITQSNRVYNMEQVEPLKKKNKKLQSLKSRFPNATLLYNHRANLPTGGLDDPNYLPSYDPSQILLREKTGFSQHQHAYAKDQARRMQERNKDTEQEEIRKWVGNPIFTLDGEFDRIDVLNILRNMNGTPDKFPYILSSFGDFLKSAHQGNVNLLMTPVDQSINWHIAAAKDSLFEGIFEWFEEILLLVCPDNLDTDKKLFFKNTAEKIPHVIFAYNKLNSYLKKLCAQKDHRKLDRYKKQSIILDLIQNFPLKLSGKNHYERLTKLPPREVTSEYPDLFRKAFALNNSRNKNRFQEKTGNATSNPNSAGKKFELSKREFQQYKDLKRHQNSKRTRKNDDRKKNSKKSRFNRGGPPRSEKASEE